MDDMTNEIGNEEEHSDMNAVFNAFKRAKLYGLQTEVVTWAMRDLKNNSELTIEQALWDALYEWDC